MTDDAAMQQNQTDDVEVLLVALPPEIAERIRHLPPERDLIEVIMDLGRPPEARFGGGGEEVLLEREVTEEDIQYVIDHIGSFGDDNRAGIERTLHRISAIRNRNGKIVGITARIGRAVFGTIEIIKDLVESGKSVLIMGRPGHRQDDDAARGRARARRRARQARRGRRHARTRSPATATSRTRASAAHGACRCARPSSSTR